MTYFLHKGSNQTLISTDLWTKLILVLKTAGQVRYPNDDNEITFIIWPCKVKVEVELKSVFRELINLTGTFRAWFRSFKVSDPGNILVLQQHGGLKMNNLSNSPTACL